MWNIWHILHPEISFFFFFPFVAVRAQTICYIFCIFLSSFIFSSLIWPLSKPPSAKSTDGRYANENYPQINYAGLQKLQRMQSNISKERNGDKTKYKIIACVHSGRNRFGIFKVWMPSCDNRKSSSSECKTEKK